MCIFCTYSTLARVSVCNNEPGHPFLSGPIECVPRNVRHSSSYRLRLLPTFGLTTRFGRVTGNDAQYVIVGVPSSVPGSTTSDGIHA